MAVIRFPLLEELLVFLRLFDNPGTYIMLIVLAMVFIPFYVKTIHTHMKNPQEYHMVSFEKKFWMGFLIILFLLVLGVVNYMRFLPV